MDFGELVKKRAERAIRRQKEETNREVDDLKAMEEVYANTEWGKITPEEWKVAKSLFGEY